MMLGKGKFAKLEIVIPKMTENQQNLILPKGQNGVNITRYELMPINAVFWWDLSHNASALLTSQV